LEQDTFQLIVKTFIQIADKHGAYVALTVCQFAFFGSLIVYLLLKLVGAHEKEIKRLVEERNKLQDMVLNKRLTSEKSK